VSDVPSVVLGDPTRLRQVLFNIVGNAVKFTEHGSVRLEMKTTGAVRDGRTGVVFAVHDTGPGIAPEARGRLFLPFEQSDGSTTRRFGGTGLGLAISKRLVDLMNGTITVTSEAGLGSMFRLELPLEIGATDTVLAAATASVAVAPPRLQACDVLVVEDNAVNQMVVTRMLARLGVKVFVVEDGQQALDILAARRFDAVLMDCHMPGMDGFEATRRLRSFETKSAKTPVIALTASALETDQLRCREAGMDAFLTKPISMVALAEALTLWVGRDSEATFTAGAGRSARARLRVT
jgi:CheY-like chemotaxis protein